MNTITSHMWKVQTSDVMDSKLIGTMEFTMQEVKSLFFFLCVCYGIHTSGVCHGSFLAEGYSSLVKVAAKLF